MYAVITSNVSISIYLCIHIQSAVEEALERIREQKGVEGWVITKFLFLRVSAMRSYSSMSTSLPSYVICNGYGDVLRSSASIAKSNSEVIAQVREMISLEALLFELE